MHAKVDELYHLVRALKERHNEAAVVKYADQPVLTEDIRKVDEIYLWFVKLKEFLRITSAKVLEHRIILQPLGKTPLVSP
jgi:hypothetical protein